MIYIPLHGRSTSQGTSKRPTLTVSSNIVKKKKNHIKLVLPVGRTKVASFGYWKGSCFQHSSNRSISVTCFIQYYQTKNPKSQYLSVSLPLYCLLEYGFLCLVRTWRASLTTDLSGSLHYKLANWVLKDLHGQHFPPNNNYGKYSSNYYYYYYYYAFLFIISQEIIGCTSCRSVTYIHRYTLSPRSTTALLTPVTLKLRWVWEKLQN